VKALNPVAQRETCLKQKGAHSVVEGAKRAFNFPVLLRGVGTRHAEGDTMGDKERAGLRIVEFTTIVALNALDGEVKLHANISTKMRKSGKVSDLRHSGKVQM
jgi:hypothetical protein